MDISEIRRRNLWAIAHPHGYSDQGVKSFADKTGKTPERIRHLIAKSPASETFKNIGTKAARDFEKTLGLTKTWLDHPHPELWGDNVAHDGNNIAETPEPYRINPIPVVSWVKAGQFCESPDDFNPGDADDWVPVRPKGAGPNTYALKVVGDSMTSSYPGGATYPEGFIIIVDPSQEVLVGMRGIFKLPETNEATFKELGSDAGRLYLKPLNDRHPLIPVTDGMITCGRVIGTYKPE